MTGGTKGEAGQGIRRSREWTYAAAAAVAAGAVFLLFIVNGAIGLIGSEDDPVNRIFLAVPATALAGALLARFRARGMAIALAVTAAAQPVAGIVAAIIVPDLGGLAAATALFTPLWLGSAWLFRRAATSGA